MLATKYSIDILVQQRAFWGFPYNVYISQDVTDQQTAAGRILLRKTGSRNQYEGSEHQINASAQAIHYI